MVLQFARNNSGVMKRKLLIPDEKIIDKIYMIRGQKIMLDSDLALMYDVPTKVLKQAVRRNKSRFPPDFMFEMTTDEFRNWRSQIVTSNFSVKMGLRYAPFCFTEHGVAMLSSVLKSKKAVEVNIRIIRIFTRIREALLSNKEILSRLEKLERKINKNDEDIRSIFNALKHLLNPPALPRKKIGFKRYD
jgi:hypothetical protein